MIDIRARDAGKSQREASLDNFFLYQKMESDEVLESRRKYNFRHWKERNPHKVLEVLIFIFDSYSLGPAGICTTYVCFLFLV